MKIFFFTDCMGNAPKTIEQSMKYPALVKSIIKEKYGITVDFEIVFSSGETTLEAMERVEEVRRSENVDLFIFSYGINDALPRGFERSMRSKLIRAMYTLKFNAPQRLFLRTYFLNPLEYIMLLLRKPRFYNDKKSFVDNVTKIMTALETVSEYKPIYVSAPPILNYRFRNANRFIKEYDDALTPELRKSGYHHIKLFDIFDISRLQDFLADDGFHYGVLAHRHVAEAIVKVMHDNNMIQSGT